VQKGKKMLWLDLGFLVQRKNVPPGVRYAIDLSGPLRRYLTSEYRVILINYTVS
jgi:hypothetical protein